MWLVWVAGWVGGGLGEASEVYIYTAGVLVWRRLWWSVTPSSLWAAESGTMGSRLFSVLCRFKCGRNVALTINPGLNLAC